MTPEVEQAIWRAINELRARNRHMIDELSARIGRLELNPALSKESLGDEFRIAMEKCVSIHEALVKDYHTEHERGQDEK